MYQVIKILYERPGNDSVALATKLKRFFNASCKVAFVCQAELSLSE